MFKHDKLKLVNKGIKEEIKKCIIEHFSPPWFDDIWNTPWFVEEELYELYNDEFIKQFGKDTMNKINHDIIYSVCHHLSCALRTYYNISIDYYEIEESHMIDYACMFIDKQFENIDLWGIEFSEQLSENDPPEED